MRHARLVALLALAAQRGAAAAVPLQDALSPAGPQAARIHDLWNLTLAICTLVFAAVLAALIVALWRRPRADAGTPADVDASQRPERGARRSVAAAVAASVLLLVFLIVASVLTDRALAQLSLKDAVRIELTSNQWWWEAKYNDSEPARVFTTANELHIPVGRPVLVTLKSNDVIHSLWVPNLAGKKDMIPGRTATLQLQADRPGIYRGQCAEFCGFQHAFMALEVVARPNAEYEAWADAQRASAPEPRDPQAQRGRAVFLSTSCVMCHSIQGTSANAHRAPDLTHVASRGRLAAGTLPNTAEAMHQWIRNPQRYKPGSTMPATTLPDEDIQAIVTYLQGLQ